MMSRQFRAFLRRRDQRYGKSDIHKIKTNQSSAGDGDKKLQYFGCKKIGHMVADGPVRLEEKFFETIRDSRDKRKKRKDKKERKNRKKALWAFSDSESQASSADEEINFCLMARGSSTRGDHVEESSTETLGLPHTLASIVWLCGPVAGLLVAPTVGIWSDRCKSRFGRRRPFILTGCITICCAVLMIGFSSDIGSAFGDTKENCSSYSGPRWKAAIVYVAGFWVLDFSNNLVQSPARAMMSDLSGIHGCNAGNIIYAFWMAFGNVLGYSSGSTGSWHKWFPFLMTNSCCEACANLKAAFLVAVVVLSLCLTVTLICAKEVPLVKLLGPAEVLQENSGFFSILRAFKNLPAGMSSVLLVTSLTWLAWFPFLLYDTDWMGREIYHGDPNGTRAEIDAYNKGVQQGAFGLLLNSIVLGISSMILEPMCRKFTSRVVWVSGNFIVFIAMAAVTVLSIISTKGHSSSMSSEVGGSYGLKVGALSIFAALGFPLAILFSIPFASAGQLAVNEGGYKQGLCIGILNIFIVIPQVIVALGVGPWGAIFGKGNTPAFALASALALLGGFVALAVLPKPPGGFLLKRIAWFKSIVCFGNPTWSGYLLQSTSTFPSPLRSTDSLSADINLR